MLLALHLIVLGQPTNLSPFMLLALAGSAAGDTISSFLDALTGPIIASLDPKAEEVLRAWLVLSPEDPLVPEGLHMHQAPAVSFLLHFVDFLTVRYHC